MSDPAYRARAIDMASLPRSVQQRAHQLDNGEVMWRSEDAASAIEALATARRVVLGLDVRDYRFDGSFVEVAWSSFEPVGDGDDAERGRTAALSALFPDPLPGEWVVITWT